MTAPAPGSPEAARPRRAVRRIANLIQGLALGPLLLLALLELAAQAGNVMPFKYQGF